MRSWFLSCIPFHSAPYTSPHRIPSANKGQRHFSILWRQGIVSRGTPKCNWSFFAFFPLHASKTSLEVLRYILMMLELVGWNQSSTTAVAVEKPMIVTRLEGIERRGCHPLPLAFYRWRRNRHWCKLPVQRMSLRHCKYVHYYLPLSLSSACRDCRLNATRFLFFCCVAVCAQIKLPRDTVLIPT